MLLGLYQRNHQGVSMSWGLCRWCFLLCWTIHAWTTLAYLRLITPLLTQAEASPLKGALKEFVDGARDLYWSHLDHPSLVAKHWGICYPCWGKLHRKFVRRCCCKWPLMTTLERFHPKFVSNVGSPRMISLVTRIPLPWWATGAPMGRWRPRIMVCPRSVSVSRRRKNTIAAEYHWTPSPLRTSCKL